MDLQISPIKFYDSGIGEPTEFGADKNQPHVILMSLVLEPKCKMSLYIQGELY